MSRLLLCVLLIAGGVSLLDHPAAAPAGAPQGAPVSVAILAAEDARASTPEALAPVLDAAERGSPEVRRAAVRALGRLERPDLAPPLIARLRDESTDVRAEAANALAQAVSRVESDERIEAVREALVEGLDRERDGAVRGAIAEALGRLPVAGGGDFREVDEVLRDVTETLSPPSFGVGGGTAPRTPWGTPVGGVTLGFDRRPVPHAAVQILGAVKGLESLARRNADVAALDEDTIERLRELIASNDLERQSRLGRGSRDWAAGLTRFAEEAQARARRLALAALSVSGSVDDDTRRAALESDDWQLRRLALLDAAHVAESAPERVAELILDAFDDQAWQVRYEALGAYGPYRMGGGCAPLVRAASDRNPHVVLRAIDLLGVDCPRGEVGPVLDREAARLPDETAPAPAGRAAWHRPAHAMVALARIAPEQARARLESFAAHPVWQVRMYAARAAAVLQRTETLEALAADPHPNVREAALAGLADLVAHAADRVYLDALAAEDSQLVRAAARALEGSPNAEKAVPALLRALERITAERRDTSRDPRLALLDRLAELATPAHAEALRPYLTDFDPRVAARAAAILTDWTGSAVQPRAQPLTPPPLPGAEELAGLGRSIARVRMAGLGTFELELLVSEAPVTVARFARLARAGYYDGLTFHRVVPNFVIQGGSPGANEYVGVGPYLRDEVGLAPHVRGAVGISTRGRDTGDAQIFIDLVDNPRLDHQYTVFAHVTRGMDRIVDAALEGAVIEKIEIVRK